MRRRLPASTGRGGGDRGHIGYYRRRGAEQRHLLSYQWLRYDGRTVSDIAGATGSSYVLAAEDAGKTILVRVSFTDDGGNAETRIGEVPLTAELRRVPDSHNGSESFSFRILFSEPVVFGFRALRKQSLDVSNGTIRDVRRVSGRNDLWEITVQPSTDAAVVLVLPTPRTVPLTVRSAPATTGVCPHGWRSPCRVLGPPIRRREGAPTISGSLEAGRTITSDTSGISDADGLVNAAFSYQWIASDGNYDTDIADATGASCTLTSNDVGKFIKVRFPSPTTQAMTRPLPARLRQR